MKINRNQFFFIFFLFSSSVLAFYHSRGFIPYDEGWIAQVSLRQLHGEAIYKNIQLGYNPGIIYLTTLTFKIFGVSILSERILGFVNSIVTLWLIFLISRNLKLSRLHVLLTSFTYLFWGPAIVNFVWPVMFSITAGIAVTYFLTLHQIEDTLARNFLLAGVFSFFAFFFKQNFGVAIFLSSLIYLVFQKTTKKMFYLKSYLVGYLMLIVIQILVFVKEGILNDYFREIYFFTYEKIIKEGVVNTNFPWEFTSNWFIKISKTSFYLLPLLISLYCFLLLLKSKKQKFLYPSLFVTAYYTFSIRPTTDFIHLAPLISISGICLAQIIQRFNKSKSRLIPVGMWILIILVGVYCSLFRGYYKWEPPLTKHNVFVNHPRVNVFTSSEMATVIDNLTKYFNDNNEEDELFIFEYSPMFYLILDKKNPTKYDFLHVGVRSPEIDLDILDALNDKNIKHVITDIPINSEKNSITNFIYTNYYEDYSIDKYTVWARTHY